MKPLHFGALALTLFLSHSSARAQGGAPDLSDFAGAAAQEGLAKRAEAAPPKTLAPAPATGFASGLTVPRVKPGQAARGVFAELRKQTEEAAVTQPDMMKVVPALKELEMQAPTLLKEIEKQLLTKYGFAPRDMGTAYAVAFLSLHESATGQKTTDLQDKAAGRSLSSAIGQFWAPKWKSLPPAEKEKLYESLIMSSALTDMLIQSMTTAKRDEEVATLRASAGETFEKLVGVSPENVKIAADGRISGLSEK
ncbi:MAG TPA: DUF6683 family protein [Abditibacterium sp.]|jgi:hypothetical protein